MDGYIKDKIKRASKGGHQHTRKTRTFLTEEIARAKNQTWSSSATVAALHFHLIIVLLLNSTRRSTMLSASFDQDAREEIVDKLHGALSAFRRERDELHRKKELAVERLRVAKEQQEATEKTIHDMQDKLNHISKSGSDDANKELKGIEKEVERLHREVSPTNCKVGYIMLVEASSDMIVAGSVSAHRATFQAQQIIATQ